MLNVESLRELLFLLHDFERISFRDLDTFLQSNMERLDKIRSAYREV